MDVMSTVDHGAPTILDRPIGLHASGQRREFDSLGEVEVPANRYWGAQTQRSLEHYAIDHDLTLKEAALANGVTEELFDRVVDPLALTRGGSADIPASPGKA